MAVQGKEHKLSIRITGSVDSSLDRSLASAKARTKGFSSTLNRLDANFRRLDKGFSKMTKFLGKTFRAIERGALTSGKVISAIGIASTVAGARFEEAFAGVKKTVKGTREEYNELREEILKTTRVIPRSGEKLAKAMEVAGQLGIKKKSLPNFVKTMANLEVSTNLSSEDAATSLARFANITSMKDFDRKGISNYERLGSVVVELGNNFATTEQEIVDMGLNLSATGKLVNLSESQIMALATAMSAVGIKAEKGGTAMSKLLRKVQMAVELNSGSLKQYASVSGMNTKEFKAEFKRDSLSAVSKFIKGLNDTKRNGKSAIAIIDEMKLKEIRLSDTILRLAGAGDLLNEAVKHSKKAWKQNIALTEEANKKYETFGSQIKLVGNAFVEAGIKIYDNLTRTPLVKFFKKIKEGIHDFTDNHLKGWLDKINTSFPTFKRHLRSLGNDGPMIARIGIGIGKFVLGTGKWIVSNGDYVLSVMTGIGTAMAGYKVASSGIHFLKFLTGLSPTMVAVTGTATGLAAIVSYIGILDANKQRKIGETLRKSFGNIALSMEDIEKVAKNIIRSKTFDKLNKSFQEFKKADDLANVLKDTLTDIERRNWKASVGVKFGSDEKSDYKSSIKSYIKKAQEYVLQERYSVSVGLKLSQGKNSPIVDKIDKFYSAAFLEMQKLGEQLSKAVNKAFSDNILDPNEIEKIANIQRKMADLQAKIATSDYTVGLLKLGAKFDGTKLDADTFQNLQEELSKQTETAREKYLEAYGRNVSGIQNTYDNNGMSKAEYEEALNVEKKAYLKNMAEVYEKSARFQINTIQKMHEKETNRIFDELIKKKASREAWGYTPDSVINDMHGSFFGEYGYLERSSERLAEKLSTTKKELEKIQNEYQTFGISIPKTVSDTLKKIEEAESGLVLGSSKFYDPVEFENELAKRIGRSNFAETYKNIFSDVEKKLKETNTPVPDTFFDKVEEGFLEKSSKAFKDAHKGFAAFSTKYFRDWVDSKPFDFEADISIILNPRLNALSRLGSTIAGKGKTDNSFVKNGNLKIYKNARGGIWRKPILTTFAEKGPEAAIPIDGSKRAVSLWEKTGRLLGMKSRVQDVDLSGTGNSPKIEYKPTLQFYGEAPKEKDLKNALSISQKEFNSMMDQYVRTRGRLAF